MACDNDAYDISPGIDARLRLSRDCSTALITACNTPSQVDSTDRLQVSGFAQDSQKAGLYVVVGVTGKLCVKHRA